MPERKILVTSALPYANGNIHLGHLLEHIQSDIWVRYQRMVGNECHYICADDAHGAAIMISAEKSGEDVESMIARMRTEHENDLRAFDVDFSNYYTTHSAENKHLSSQIYQKLNKGGYIKTQQIEQMYDPERNMFLADRFIKGRCPQCDTPDQYGDNCEQCGATYNAFELIEPYSVYSGAKPIRKASEHYFFDLPAFSPMLKKWLENDGIQPEVRNKLQEWFHAGLQQWDVTRDAPYFGFLIPGKKDKYLYVWLDAPVGYMAGFYNYCEQQRIDFDAYWNAQSETELYHFIGKDIIYFHGLFWPAMLEGAGYRKPTAIFAHGFLTIDGQKMSKSRGTFITAQSYLKHLQPECLRYYFASKLSDKVEDIDLNLADFVQKVNSDIAGKLVNIAARSSSFINRHFDNALCAHPANEDLMTQIEEAKTPICQCYEQRKYSQVIRTVMLLADKVNQYIDQQQPWKAIKEDEKRVQVHADCSFALEAFWKLVCYLQPVMPQLFARACSLFCFVEQPQLPLASNIRGTAITTFTHMFSRIDSSTIDAMITDNTDKSNAKN